MLYFGPSHPFSHLHACSLTLLGESWTTVEQFYQHAKARLALDNDTAERIVAETDGKEQKRLSKQIQNPRNFLWNRVKYAVMLSADFQKYRQNDSIRDFLLSTGHRDLIENNRFDPYWGPPGNHAGNILLRLRRHFSEASDLPTVYILGDSLLKNIDQSFISDQVKSRCICISFPGAKLEYIMQVCSFVSSAFVQKVVIFGGTNDLASRDNKAKLGPNRLFRRVHKFISSYSLLFPQIHVYFCTILNRPRNKDSRIESHITRYNEMLVDNDISNVNISVINFGDFPNSDFSNDGLHLSKMGTLRLQSELIRTLQ